MGQGEAASLGWRTHQLLLAEAGNHQPVLKEGLVLEASQQPPSPRPLPGRVEVPTLDAPDADRYNLEAQRWGVIAPVGEAGDLMLEAIKSLMDHREKEQGSKVKEYRVPPMNFNEAVDWRNTELNAAEPEERPWYLLILGDLHQVSMELQQVLAFESCVGRLHVGTPDGEVDEAGYAAYAKKVLVHERHTAQADVPDVLLYTAQDDTPATRAGHRLLVEPCLEVMQTRWKAKRPNLNPRLVPSGRDALLRAAREARAGVMVTVAHGLGRPQSGWGSPEEQRALQGALSLGGDVKLSGDMMRQTPFLPGGLWFNVACFGAATPATSVYIEWVEQLVQSKADGSSTIERVLRGLPAKGERPFMAALPQALLANEQGPLAIIGHCDLAWVNSFEQLGKGWNSLSSHIRSGLETVSKGNRVGVGFQALVRAYQTVHNGFMLNEEARVRARRDGIETSIDAVKQSALWMLLNDLRNYVLLGDPAARLPVRRVSR